MPKSTPCLHKDSKASVRPRLQCDLGSSRTQPITRGGRTLSKLPQKGLVCLGIWMISNNCANLTRNVALKSCILCAASLGLRSNLPSFSIDISGSEKSWKMRVTSCPSGVFRTPRPLGMLLSSTYLNSSRAVVEMLPLQLHPSFHYTASPSPPDSFVTASIV